MQLLDVMVPVGAATTILYDKYDLLYFMFDFDLENQSDGDVVVTAQESADGVTWSNIAAGTTMVPRGVVSLSAQCSSKNFRVTVARDTGSIASGVVRGTLTLPDWMADRQVESRVDLACKAACQNDCETACQGSCEAGCQTACELSSESV